ncbi:hypothetical protein H6F89_21770 [Cyanobacteria bacterium FACHB-63]|nr:hypothetical protein [Cyanobacteria bacterium FACHB-63]
MYNLSGGRENSILILETFDLVEQSTGRTVNWMYVEENRIGDRIGYISDLRKLKQHFPEWQLTDRITDLLQQIIAAENTRYAPIQ